MHPNPVAIAAHKRHERDREQRGHRDPSPVAAPAHLDVALVHALASRPPAMTVSIYLPTHRAGSDKQQDHTRVKNLINESRKLLNSAIDEKRGNDQLESLERLGEEPGFWAHPQDALALFCSDAWVTHIWLPETTGEMAVLSEHCHIKPMLPMIQEDGPFYLLELAQHGVHLHSGSRFGLNPIDLPGAPSSIDEVLGTPDHEHHTEVRAQHASGQGGVRNFGSEGDERAKDNVRKYFRRIDTCILRLLHAERIPLVLAGVEYLLPLYAEVNGYAHLVPGGITGNSDLLPTSTLHDHAWAMVAPVYRTAVLRARERLAQFIGTDRVSLNLPMVLRGLVQGRVEDLFVAGDAQRWGTYDPINELVREHAPRWPADDDLLNLAVIQAFAARTHVVVLPKAQMPGNSDIAAVFRYA